MRANETVPVVVGVTGHRVLREEDRSALRQAVRTELKKLQTLCPHSPLVLLTSLAEGADLLCADTAAELNIPLIAVLPREQAEYRTDFSEPALQRFAEHYASAAQAFVAPVTEEKPESQAAATEIVYKKREEPEIDPEIAALYVKPESDESKETQETEESEE